MQRKASIQKQQQCASIMAHIQSHIQNPLVGSFPNNFGEGSGSENVSITITNSGAEMESFSL
jgi:hypothetical protein